MDSVINFQGTGGRRRVETKLPRAPEFCTNTHLWPGAEKKVLPAPVRLQLPKISFALAPLRFLKIVLGFAPASASWKWFCSELHSRAGTEPELEAKPGAWAEPGAGSAFSSLSPFLSFPPLTFPKTRPPEAGAQSPGASHFSEELQLVPRLSSRLYNSGVSSMAPALAPNSTPSFSNKPEAGDGSSSNV